MIMEKSKQKLHLKIEYFIYCMYHKKFDILHTINTLLPWGQSLANQRTHNY